MARVSLDVISITAGYQKSSCKNRNTICFTDR